MFEGSEDLFKVFNPNLQQPIKPDHQLQVSDNIFKRK